MIRTLHSLAQELKKKKAPQKKQNVTKRLGSNVKSFPTDNLRSNEN